MTSSVYFQHLLHGQLHAHEKERAAAEAQQPDIQGGEDVQVDGDNLVGRQEQVMLDHYYEDFEGTETASIDFDNRTTLRSTTVTVEGVDSGDAGAEMTTDGATADVAMSEQTFELPMTEQHFRAVKQKVNEPSVAYTERKCKLT